MSSLEIYRVKDLSTGKYYQKGKYSYYTHSMTRRGKLWSAVRYIKEHLWNSRVKIYLINQGKSQFISFKERIDLENTVDKFFPDTWVIVDRDDKVVMTVNELLKDVK